MELLTKIVKTLLFISIVIIFSVSSADQTNAGTLTFGLDFEFSGATEPEGSPPWIKATFDDSFGGANDVRLTMSANNLVDQEFVGSWFFNFDPVLDPTNLTITPFDDSAIGTTNILTNDPSISTDDATFKADGDGVFDILFDFPPPPGNFPSKFTTGETVVYDISYTSAIDASSFNFFSTDGGNEKGNLLSAAHVQGIGPTDDDSGWIGVVPEPISSILFVIGGAVLAGRRYLRKKK